MLFVTFLISFNYCSKRKKIPELVGDAEIMPNTFLLFFGVCVCINSFHAILSNWLFAHFVNLPLVIH